MLIERLSDYAAASFFSRLYQQSSKLVSSFCCLRLSLFDLNEVKDGLFTDFRQSGELASPFCVADSSERAKEGAALPSQKTEKKT